MLEFQQKRKVRKILYSRTALIVLCVVAAVFLRATWNVYEKERLSEEYVSQASAQLDKISAKKEAISSSVSALGTDKGIEAEIRRKFRVVKDGEQIAVIVDDTAISGGRDQSSASSTGQGFWHGVASFFGF
jgi:cell division protein FtsB